ncbi:magnesium chelatase subunit D [Aerophototrophica crusticola]|uniref:magnesium chelatase subunit D n=1 Tax=Aerophototrophica crusticola TaxID=1709002 RepID=UPI00384BD5F3
MTDGADSGDHPWDSAARAAALFAVDPHGLGGVLLRAAPGPARDRWLGWLARLLPQGPPLRRLPVGVDDAGLLGGLDLAATLNAGRPVVSRGALAEADGGVLLLAMAERLPHGTAARLAAALDEGEVVLERDGLARRFPARVGVVALDEGIGPEERPPAALADRLAFPLDLEGLPARDPDPALPDHRAVEGARRLMPLVTADGKVAEALCAAALALGIYSLRAPLQALRAARAAAALDGRVVVLAEDASLAARLVLAPRATQVPATEDTADDPPPDPPPTGEAEEGSADPLDAPPLDDLVLAAAQAAIPAGLLALLRAGLAPKGSTSQGSRAGALQSGKGRGRPAGVRRGSPKSGLRLSVIETLRAAAPWQALRRAEAQDDRIQVRRDDFRVAKLKRRSQTTTIFVVDASGSAAFQRLAEAKGAVELLLADCYVRRDQVALLAFRAEGAELLLPPPGPCPGPSAAWRSCRAAGRHPWPQASRRRACWRRGNGAGAVSPASCC